ncbi:MAG: DNA primase [Lentisphaeraceae bacterium]|nr:DNA primase [Lentisphaeraceae bacterium]
MAGIDDAVIQQVKDRADILDVIGSVTPVKKAGRNYLALCPFHNEKTPSFNVNADNQFYHCFGCGASGDVISFVKNHENVDFVDAVKMLADRYGIVIQESNNYNPQAQSEKARLYELHKDAAEWFGKNLKKPEAMHVMSYLTNRGITSSDIDTFQIGYAPDSWDAFISWAQGKGYNMETLIKSGLIIHNEEKNSHYDRFRDRVMFSIWNDEGKVIAFSGRVLEKDSKGAKYVNSPETPIFYKSSVLYGLPMAKTHIRDKGTALLCEGQLDVIACHRAGLKNAVSSQGTAFTEDHAKKLKRYAERIVIAYDSDSAGKEAAFKCLQYLLPTGLSTSILNWGEGEDPDSLYAAKGPEALTTCLSSARDSFEVMVDHLSTKHDIYSPEGKSKIAHRMIEEVSRIPDSIRRSDYCQNIAERLQVPPDSIFRELKKFYRKSFSRNNKFEQPAPTEFNMPVNFELTLQNKAELQLIELVTSFEDVAYKLVEELDSQYVSNSVIGGCLKEILDLTLAGDWYSSKDTVQNTYAPQHQEIAKVLVQPEYTTDLDRDIIDRAYKECLKTIIKTPLINRRDFILRSLKDPNQDASSLKVEYQQIMAQLREMK